LNKPPRRICPCAGHEPAENARRSHIGAARSPRCDSRTCRARRLPSTGWGWYSPITSSLTFSHWAKARGSWAF